MTRRKPSSPREDSQLNQLGEAIAKAAPIDWEAESEREPSLRQQLRRMQQIEALARAHRSIADGHAEPSTAPLHLFDWGPFRALEMVGEGGFGQVYRALDLRLHREVALKLRRVDADGDDTGARRFLDEARHLARIRHSNVLVVHGADVHDGRAGFWTDFIRGRTLEAWIAQSGPLTSEEAARIGVSLCRALEAVHTAGLIHGDVKASNVMQEEGGRILLMDFGAVNRRADGGTWPGGAPQTHGTPLVLAPEVLHGEPPQPSADLYSLGVLLYFLVVGRLPVAATSWAELLRWHEAQSITASGLGSHGVAPALAAVIERATRREAGARYQSAAEMEHALLSATPSIQDSLEGGQTLRSLLSELGSVPEELCRQIGRELVKVMRATREGAAEHAAGDERAAAGIELENDTMELLPLDRVILRPDGRALLLDGERDLYPLRTSRGRAVELPLLGRTLFELATGRPFSTEQDLIASERLSPFLQELIRCLVIPGADPGLSSLREVSVVLREGEKGSWWRGRVRALRRSSRMKPRRALIARDTAIHGRQEAMHDLLTAYESACAGEGRTILLLGEAGIGKTRLVDEFVSQLERKEEPFYFLLGSYPPGDASTEAGAFLNAYRDHFGDTDLEAILSDYLRAAPFLVPPLLTLLHGHGGRADADAVSRDLLQRALVQLTHALAAERATIILIDDLHFAPAEGREMFAVLAQAVAGHRILLLGGARPDIPQDWRANLERLEHVQALPLARLTTDDVRGLLAEALGSQLLARELAPALATRSDGNPLFLFEYLRGLDDRNLQGSAPGRAASTARGMATPASIRELINARFASLEEEDKELLDIACCLGFEFDPDLVARAAGKGAVSVLRRFARIEKNHRLIRSAGRTYVFDHHEAQQALYYGLFEPLREQYHLALAGALEAREHASERDPSDLEGAVAVALTEHYLKGGGGTQAVRYLARALDHLEGSNSESAVRLSDLALGARGLLTGRLRGDVIAQKVRCLAVLGRAEDEEAALHELHELSESSGEVRARAEAKVLLGDLYVRSSRNDEARVLLDESLRLAEECGDLAIQQFAVVTQTTLFLGTGRNEEALRSCARSLELSRQRGERRGEATAHGHMGIVLGSLGRPEEARPHFERALSLAREIGYAMGEALAVCNLGVVHDNLGQYGPALEFQEQFLDLSRKLGFRRGEARAEANLGAILRKLGRPAEALEHLERALQGLRAVGMRLGETGALESYASTYALIGQWDEARSHFERTLELSREIQNPREEADALFGLAEIANQLDDCAAAECMYRDAMERWARIDDQEGVARVHLALGALLLGRGRVTDAASHFQEALSMAQACDAWGVTTLASIHAAALGQEAFEGARVTFAREAPRLEFAERMLACFLLWQGGGDLADLREAHRLLLELRDRAPLPCQESMTTRVPLYRKILAAVRDQDPDGRPGHTGPVSSPLTGASETGDEI